MALIFGCKRNISSAPAMMTPVPPRSKSPLTQLTISPRTCVAMITTASLHPQTRRWNHPIPAVVRAAPSSRKKNPTILPKGALLVRYRIESPETIEGRASPKQSSRGEARHNGTKEQENAYRCESWRLSSDSEIEPGAIVVPHLLNISQLRNPRSDCSRKIANATRNQSASSQLLLIGLIQQSTICWGQA